MNKKENLIKGLKTAIFALENKTIFYQWNKQDSCNCGIVAQAVLGERRDVIGGMFNQISAKLQRLDKEDFRDETWRNGLQHFCSLTGQTEIEIFKRLFDAGMSPEDITHLEYLDNKAILKRANIRTRTFLGFKKTHYDKRENLIKYLKAWVSILEEQSNSTPKTKIQKEEEMLKAVVEENYEMAAQLRDELAIA